MASGGVEAITDASWESAVSGSPLPVLVCFWAEWCVPSRTVAAVLEAAASRHAGRLRVGRARVDESPEAARRADVRGLPTVVLFDAGREIDRRVGLVSPADVARLVDGRV